jgi:MYXO-CTERM domain-containing protein
VVTDSLGDAATADVALNVIDPDKTLAVTPSPLPQAVVGEEYCDPEPIRLYASGGFPPYAWSVLSPLPAGMALSESGELCGIPSETGDFAMTIRVEDGAGVFDTSLFILRVRHQSELAVTVTALLDARIGEMYSAALTARQGVEPYGWRIADGALPSGLELSPDGTISGTPSMVETAVFAVEVTDAAMQTRLQPLSLRVTDGEVDAGCGCSAARSRRASPLMLLVASAIALGSRRRRRS